jgi:hypothetical protein
MRLALHLSIDELAHVCHGPPLKFPTPPLEGDLAHPEPVALAAQGSGGAFPGTRRRNYCAKIAFMNGLVAQLQILPSSTRTVATLRCNAAHTEDGNEARSAVWHLSCEVSRDEHRPHSSTRCVLPDK